MIEHYLSYWKQVIMFYLFMVISYLVAGQPLSYNFHKLGFKEGLHDGIIRCINQDQYGYIWVGSVGAVNRYNGRYFKKYTHIPEDTLSPLGTQPRTMHNDLKGRFWIGFENGLMQFDFVTETFHSIKYFKNIFIRSICSIDENIIFVGTSNGLYKYDVKSDTIFFYGKSDQTKHFYLKNNRIYDIKLKKGVLYIGSEKGLIKLNIADDAAQPIINNSLINIPIVSLALDRQNNVWFCSFGKIKLGKIRYKERDVINYNEFLEIGNDQQPYHVAACIVDSSNRFWVATIQQGLMQYDALSDQFVKIKHQENIPASPSDNTYRCIFLDRTGLIWMGFDVEGINYFNPDKNLFASIPPFPLYGVPTLNQVGRAVTSDNNGNLWFGNHDGVSSYNPKNGKYTIYRNDNTGKKVLYSNHVRSMYCDKENNVWIGTSDGVNRFNNTTQVMEFIDSRSLPLSFYNSINGDRSGNIWFCTNDTASLYWYNIKSRQYGNISKHIQLKKYAGYTPVSYVLEDSKNRLWISTSRKGVVMFDKKTKKIMHLSASDTSLHRLIGNLVVDIKEDKAGFIWMATFTGITALNLEKNIVLHYNALNKLPGNMVGPLVIDDEDRVWAGVNGGLTMIERDRKKIRYFSEVDGLATVGFPEHAGIKTSSGKIILSSNSGFIYFNPSMYKEEKNNYPFYIRACKIQDKDRKVFEERLNESSIDLRHSENSFAFEFEALNYSNPQNTKFAYFLEGFDNQWHYTTEQQAFYTNVPGGKYTFYMKSTDGEGNWAAIKAKSVKIHLQTIFYKTTLFKLFSIAFVLLLFYLFYQYRRGQQKQLYDLKNKAQLLEKEKATAMFENLKQQLNPHFLFNSLTSLSGLIELNQTSASKFLNQMSVIYRYILKNAEAETVSLKEEIDFVTMYVNLQKTRFSEGLQVNINITPDFHHYKIAPVTLQNLIENAIKHNVIDKYRPLRIEIYIENNEYIVVENNLQKKLLVETSNQRGLKQFISLYRFLSHLPIIIENDNESMFKIKIPLI